MNFGFILSAGKETRFADDMPKALSLFKGKPLLDHNLEVMWGHCNVVKVVITEQKKPFFLEYATLIIESGRGCGDAVMSALQVFDFCEDDMCFIGWGDCIFNEIVARRCVDTYKKDYDIVIPCHFEEEPYVRLAEEQGRVRVDFGKYGEISGPGLHDFGFFYGRCLPIFNHLKEFRDIILDGEVYKHKHGDEMEFLDVFNETGIKGQLLEIDDIEPLSFNTTEELSKIG